MLFIVRYASNKLGTTVGCDYDCFSDAHLGGHHGTTEEQIKPVDEIAKDLINERHVESEISSNPALQKEIMNEAQQIYNSLQTYSSEQAAYSQN